MPMMKLKEAMEGGEWLLKERRGGEGAFNVRY
jgi:hypothetical protein